MHRKPKHDEAMTEKETFRLTSEVDDLLDALVEDGPYPNRSEAARAAVTSHAEDVLGEGA